MKQRDTDTQHDVDENNGQESDVQLTKNARRKQEDVDLDDIPWEGESRRAVDVGCDAMAEDKGGEPEQPADSGGDQEKRGNKVGAFLMSLLSGSILSKSEVRRAYPFMILVACLAFIYIAYVFSIQSMYREHLKLTEQVKELRAKSMSIASEKMRATRQSHIMTELGRRGIPLKESLVPNKVIPKRRQHEQHVEEAADR